jgi:hypothetical protein
MPFQTILSSALSILTEYLTSLGLFHNSMTMLYLTKNAMASVALHASLYPLFLNMLVDGIVLFTVHWGISWVLNKVVKPILRESQLLSHVISPILDYVSGNHMVRIFDNMAQDVHRSRSMGQHSNRSDFNQTTNYFLNFMASSTALVTTVLMALKGHSFPNPYASLSRYFGTWRLSATHWYFLTRASWSLSRIGTGLIVAEFIAYGYRCAISLLAMYMRDNGLIFSSGLSYKASWSATTLRSISQSADRAIIQVIDPYDSTPESEVRLYTPQPQ